MWRLGFGLVALIVAVGPVAAASPNPNDLIVPPAEQARARELVRKLGSEVYDTREAAHGELAKMGRLAFPSLMEGINATPSSEAGFRCRELLPQACAADLQARIDTFLADTEGKYDHDLPGWNQFRKVTGNSKAARTAFTELLGEAENRDILLAVGGPANDLDTIVAARKQEIYNWRIGRIPGRPIGAGVGPVGGPASRREPTVADVVTLLFAESQVPSKNVPRGIVALSIFTTPTVVAAISDGSEKGRVYKALAAHWIETREDPASLYQGMNFATTLGLNDQAIGAAAKLVANTGGATSYRLYAVMTLARLEAKQHLPVVEALLTDETQPGARVVRFVGGQQVNHEAQVRDVALAAALLLTGQEPTDYGFTTQYGDSGPNKYNYMNWILAADRRAAAFEKWKAWRADHPVADKPTADKKP